MHRTIIKPQTREDLLIQLPETFLNKEIEILAFPVEENRTMDMTPKHKYEDAVAFYKRNAVDFTGVEKWSREDLYE